MYRIVRIVFVVIALGAFAGIVGNIDYADALIADAQYKVWLANRDHPATYATVCQREQYASKPVCRFYAPEEQ